MSITDELRERIDAVCRVSGWDCKRLTAIADRIDEMHEEALQREHESAYDKGYDAGFASADDWCAQHEDAMAEHGWVRLPKDADGEPIHIGDELRDEWHEQNQGEVEWLMLDHHGWWLMFKNNCERFYLHEFHEWHHHHAPTVEDVLRDMHAKLDEVTALYVGEAIDSDERDSDEARIFAEYAAKLQLKENA